MAAHVCPVWAGCFLASRLRKLMQNPYEILWPYITEAMTVLDVGSAMGFFSLPMAEMVGPRGRVVCVDVQPGMLKGLRQRATRAGFSDRIDTHVSTAETIDLKDSEDRFDFVLAFAVLHEVSNQVSFLGEIHRILKPCARFLLAEPIKHVSPEEFDRTISEALTQGLVVVDRPLIRLSHAAVLRKPEVRQP